MKRPLFFKAALEQKVKHISKHLIPVENAENFGQNAVWLNSRWKEITKDENFYLAKDYFSIIFIPNAINIDFPNEKTKNDLLIRREKALEYLATCELYKKMITPETSHIGEWNELEKVREIYDLFDFARESTESLSEVIEHINQMDDNLIKRVFYQQDAKV